MDFFSSLSAAKIGGGKGEGLFSGEKWWDGGLGPFQGAQPFLGGTTNF